MQMNMKTIRMVGMGTLAVGMVGWMGVDFLSQPSTPPMSSDVPTEILTQVDESPEQEVAMLVAEQALDPEPEFVLEVEAESARLKEVAMDEPQIHTQPKMESLSQPMVTFTLSESAQTVLEALEETYISQVTDAKLTAQIAQQQRQDALNQMTQEVVVMDTPVFAPTLSTVDRLTVKSIVSTPTRITAWVEINGQTVPIQRGAWVDDVRAVNITKDFVRFVNKRGEEFTKYVDTTLPIVSEKHDGKLR
ncbi:hypothetical protein SO574_23505 (plasmid) [Vibrio alfacsensis]|uniref:hypothetical protein n=1 Tax=Vibrio alfacsensis TaxID=1074311 RepID=UPI002ADD5181|nr:hypothetical protein [Vibrio alfacsensis]WQE79441.1 hypothetical protein SO574_23505 [Vibrio alfacsensis]